MVLIVHLVLFKELRLIMMLFLLAFSLKFIECSAFAAVRIDISFVIMGFGVFGSLLMLFSSSTMLLIMLASFGIELLIQVSRIGVQCVPTLVGLGVEVRERRPSQVLGARQVCWRGW